MPARGDAAYCDACGAALQAASRCARCRAVSTSVWLALVAFLVWLGALAFYWSLSRVMYADLARMYEGLGSQTPVPSRIYFVLFDHAFYPLGGLALVAFPALLVASRGEPARLRKWSRRYALSSAAGWTWAALGMAAWWLTVTSIISRLS